MRRLIILATGLFVGLAPPIWAAGEFDGEWVGEITFAPESRISCGLDKTSFRARVENDQFTGSGKDVSSEDQTFVGSIDPNGGISTWGSWRAFGYSGTEETNPTAVSGRFSSDSFVGSLSWTSTFQGFCSGKIRLARKGVASNSETAKSDAALKRLEEFAAKLVADAEEKRKTEESARLKAETERQRAVDELAKLKAQTEQAKAAEESRRIAEADREKKREAEPNPDPDPKTTGIGENLKQQLAMLKGLKEEGLIDDEEFKSKKSALLNSILGLKSATPAPSQPNHTAKRIDATDLARYASVNFGNYHALVIGNNDYKHLPDLKTARDDAKVIAKILKDDYGFDVQLLVNVTRDDILEAFDKYREELREIDNLLIYYAGHGWLDEAGEQGYWLPVDAKENRRSKWLSNATLTSTLKALEAKHVMVVADSCFSGTLTRGLKVAEKAPNYIQRMAIKRARVVLTSGGLEPVADLGGSGHSPFARAFIDALNGNKSVMDGNSMFTQLRRSVMLSADQTPEYSDARKTGHDGGDFLFVRQK